MIKFSKLFHDLFCPLKEQSILPTSPPRWESVFGKVERRGAHQEGAVGPLIIMIITIVIVIIIISSSGGPGGTLNEEQLKVLADKTSFTLENVKDFYEVTMTKVHIQIYMCKRIRELDILLFTYLRYISSPCSVFHERLSKRSNVKWKNEGDVCDNSLQEQGILYLVVKATFGTTYAEILFISPSKVHCCQWMFIVKHVNVVLDALPKPSGLLRRPVRRSTVPRLWQRRRRWHRLQGLNLKNYILFSLPGVHHRDRHVQLQQRRGETQVKSGRFRFFGGFFGWFAQFWFWCK